MDESSRVGLHILWARRAAARSSGAPRFREVDPDSLNPAPERLGASDVATAARFPNLRRFPIMRSRLFPTLALAAATLAFVGALPAAAADAGTSDPAATAAPAKMKAEGATDIAPSDAGKIAAALMTTAA